MKHRMLVALVATVAFLAGAPGAPALAQTDVSGTWVGTTETPDGVDRLTVVLKKAQAGYAGTIEDTLGHVAAGTPLQNLKVERNVLTATFVLVDGTSVTLKGTVEGDKIAGDWTHPEGVTGAVTLERQKAMEPVADGIRLKPDPTFRRAFVSAVV